MKTLNRQRAVFDVGGYISVPPGRQALFISPRQKAPIREVDATVPT